MPSQLIPAHDLDGVFQCADRSVVKIWRGQLYVTETGDFEHISIPLVAGNIEPAQISPGDPAPLGEIVSHYAERLEHISADASSLMAADTSVGLENLVALLLFVIDRGAVAAQIEIESRAWSAQRTLVCCDRVLDVVDLYAVT